MNFQQRLPYLQVLDKGDIEKLYFTALEVLERTGVSVPHREAADLLKDAGAQANYHQVKNQHFGIFWRLGKLIADRY